MSGVLVVAEHRRGELNPVTLELVTAAQDLRDGAGGPVSVAVLASDPGKFVPSVSVPGVDKVIEVKVPVDDYQPDIWEAAVETLIASEQPSVVLFPHSVDGWGSVPVLAAKQACGFASDVFGIRYEGSDLVATRAAYAEKVHVELEFPHDRLVLLTVRAGTFKPPEGDASPEVSAVDLPDVAARSRHIRFIEPEATGDVDITQSEFMLSIGRGIADEANVEVFSELADAVGATLGCSRPIADNGWLPKSRQVGQSGKTVSSCKLYVAMGISGSVQHMAGMKHVDTIVAVNTDPEASIFSIAKYGLVADIFEVGEELKSHFE